MAFKMRGFSGFKKEKNLPEEEQQRITDEKKTYPEGYTEEDIEFLERQKEDVVRYEDLDKKGKKLFLKQSRKLIKNK